MQVVTNAQWAKFEAAIAAATIRGARPRVEDRRTIEAIIWRLRHGAKWRSIPTELGDWHHAYLRLRRWAVRGVWDRIMAHLVAQGEPQLAFACIDGPIARAHQKASGARPGKDPGCVCDSLAASAAPARRWAAHAAVSAPRSLVCAMRQDGWSTSC
jgi:transposase